MFSTIRNKLVEAHRRFKAWKPIHLCWWFEKHGLPIPPYLIGGAPYGECAHWIFGDDDNSDPDLCTWDVEDTGRTDQAKTSNFMVRLQTAGVNQNNRNWELWYNTTDDPSTATQVTTSDSIVQITNGTPTDGTATTENVMTAHASYTWLDGNYFDTSNESGNYSINSEYTEFQWCVQLTASAGDSTTYYFWIMYDDGLQLDSYPATTCNVTTEAGVTTVSGSITADAVVTAASQGSVSADAVVKSGNQGSFTADAMVVRVIANSLLVDAIIKATIQSSVATDSIIKVSRQSNFTANAFVERSVNDNFTADAYITAGAVENSISADAVIKKAQSASFTVDAVFEVACAEGDEDLLKRAQAQAELDIQYLIAVYREKARNSADEERAFEFKFRQDKAGGLSAYSQKPITKTEITEWLNVDPLYTECQRRTVELEHIVSALYGIRDVLKANHQRFQCLNYGKE